MKRNRLIMALLIILSGVFASFYGGRASYSVFYLCLLAPLISLAYTFYVYLRFSYYQEIASKTVIKEESTPYRFNLSNEDFITFTNVNVTFMDKESTVKSLDSNRDYCLAPSESVDVETTLCCHYRGEYAVGIKSIEVTDFLHLFRIRYPSFSKINMRVLPRVLDITKPTFMPPDEDAKNTNFSYSSRQDFPDTDMRKYVAGDSRKMIHWKASAKKNELYSRRYYEINKSLPVIFMDLQEKPADEFQKLVYEDRIIEVSLSVGKYFLSQKKAFRFIYEENHQMNLPIQSKTDFDGFYNSCADIKFQSKRDISAIMVDNLNTVSNGGFCIVITDKMTDTLVSALNMATIRNVDVSVILLDDEENKDYKPIKSIRVIRIPAEDNLITALNLK